MQFGFMTGSETTLPIFILRQLQEKYSAKTENLKFTFVDLEKAFDRVLRDVVSWVLRKQGAEGQVEIRLYSQYIGMPKVKREWLFQ